MIDFYKNEMRLLNKELYLLGLNTNIPVYFSDSLTTIMPIKDRKERGADYIKPNTIDSLKDYWQWPKKYLDPDSVAEDISISWNISVNEGETMTYSPESIAVCIIRTLNNNIFFIPLFHFRLSDLKDKLPKEKHKLLQQYIRWKIISRTETSKLGESSQIQTYWYNWMGNQLQFSYSPNTTREIGEYTATASNEFIFLNFKANKIKLLSENQSITWEDYVLKHQRAITFSKAQIFDVIDTIGDTTYYEIPYLFDSIDIVFRNNKSIWRIWKQVSNLDESYPAMIQYTIDDADARRVLHPDLYFYCTYYARHRRD